MFRPTHSTATPVPPAATSAFRPDTPYVAIVDDDSTRLPDALPLAGELMDQHSRLGLAAAHVLTGEAQVPDAVSVEMGASPLPGEASLPGRPVLGVLACASVVRRERPCMPEVRRALLR